MQNLPSNKLTYKLHKLMSPWRWPRTEAETCRSST